MRVCVYTAIFGEYDPLSVQTQQSVPTDFLCFTESESFSLPPPWSIIVNKDRTNLNSRLRGKYFKVLSHRIFPCGYVSRELLPCDTPLVLLQYDYLIYIDASIQIVSDGFVKMIVDHLAEDAWTLVVHPDRDCVYPEAAESLRQWPKKYANSGLLKQVEDYRAEGYPAHNGLFATGVIGRKMARLDQIEVNEAWWREIMEYNSPQCQVSLPVILWRTNRCPVAPIKVRLYDNQYFKWIRHARDD